MGYGIGVKCTECQYSDVLKTGIGVMYFSLHSVIDLIEVPEQRQHVLEILNNRDVQECRFEHNLFSCPRCKTVDSHFDYEIHYDQGWIESAYFKCHACHSELERAGRPINYYRCPECGKQSLIEDKKKSKLWD